MTQLWKPVKKYMVIGKQTNFNNKIFFNQPVSSESWKVDTRSWNGIPKSPLASPICPTWKLCFSISAAQVCGCQYARPLFRWTTLLNATRHLFHNVLHPLRYATSEVMPSYSKRYEIKNTVRLIINLFEINCNKITRFILFTWFFIWLYSMKI